MKTNIAFVAIFIGFLALPYVGMAAQRAITVQSLDSAYSTQIASIDVQITQLEVKGLAGRKLEVIQSAKSTYTKSVAPLTQDEQSLLSQLKGDKHTLEVAHSLILEALK